MSLVRKEFVRPDRSTLPGEDVFRFRHLLIRDAAYEALPKSTRADLHERTAGWLEGVAGERIAEQEEILGYHLERAHGYLLELGTPGDRSRELAARASEHLATAGRRAEDRGDLSAASGLFLRAARLRPPDDRSRVRLLLAAARSQLDLGDYEGEDAVLREAAAGARAIPASRRRSSWSGRCSDRRSTRPRLPNSSRPRSERSRCWRRLAMMRRSPGPGWVVSWRGGAMGDYEGSDEATRRSLEHARRAGDRAAERAALASVTQRRVGTAAGAGWVCASG